LHLLELQVSRSRDNTQERVSATAWQWQSMHPFPIEDALGGKVPHSRGAVRHINCMSLHRAVISATLHCETLPRVGESARIRVKLPPSHHPQTNNNKPRVARWRVPLRWSPALVVNRRGAIRPRKRRVGINLTGHIAHVMTLRFETAARDRQFCEAFTSLG
jgi:hypothetical protein